MVDKNISDLHSTTDYDCPVCMTLMVEPIRVKCKHVICLNCTEKISYEEQPKCPLCRDEFDFSKDLSFPSEIYRNSLINHSKEFMIVAERILEDRYRNRGSIECLLVYGNKHKLLHDQNGDNKHDWTVFVALKRGNNKLKNCIAKLKTKANLANFFENYQNIEFQEEQKQISMVNESKIIKQITFHLHPTFNPSKIVLSKTPFEIRRIGWGTFNIPIKVEFNDILGLEPLELNFDLSFNRSINEQSRTIYIDTNKLG